MKTLCVLITALFSVAVEGQSIQVTANVPQGKTSHFEIHKNEVVNFAVIDRSSTVLTITVDDVPALSKIKIASRTKNFTKIKSDTAKVDVDRSYELISIDDKDAEVHFATINIFSVLPAPTINILNNPVLSVPPPIPCKGCADLDNSVIYDFNKNSISFNRKGLFSSKIRKDKRFGWAPVGKSYVFHVKNVNPFRDSVIISSETLSFNTETPDLFTKAFFSDFTFQGLNNKQDQLLADVLSFADQLKKIEDRMKHSDDCLDVCMVIESTSRLIKQHFEDSTYKKPVDVSLSEFFETELASVPDIYRDTVMDALNTFNHFMQSKTFADYYIPQVQNADEYVFTLSIKPKAGATSSTVVDNQIIKVPTIGGFKADFSTGLFITNLTDQQFLFIPDSSIIKNSYGGDSIVFNRRNQIVLQDNDKKIDFGVNAMLHGYWKATTLANLALSLGAGVSVRPKPSVKYLAGISLLLGRNGRLIFTYGLAGGFVDVLADGYKNLQYTTGVDHDSVIKKTFKKAEFFSVNFNIPLLKRKVDTSEASKTDTKPAADK